MSENLSALITGASRGIGRAIALELGAQGIEIYGTSTNERGVASINEMLKQQDCAGSGYMLNIASADAIKKVFNDFPSPPNIIVNNAGITRDNFLIKMNESAWNEVIQTNLSSIYWICKMSSRAMMKSRWGRIINITSISGLMGNAGQCNYAAAKAGMIGFSKSLARELAPRNITVNCIAPGFIDTDMTKALSEDIREEIIKAIPLGRFGKPKDIAKVVSLLVSEAGSYITGETICVSGGLYM